MRSIGRLHDQRQAETLLDYLLTLQIRAKVERIETPDAATSFELWVFDEDRREAAKESFDAFVAEPHADRFLAASKAAARLRRDEIEREHETRRKYQEANRAASPNRYGRRPITMVLLVLSILVFIMTDGADPKNGAPIMNKLFISAYDFGVYDFGNLVEVREGQWWRLVTPIFMHLSTVHILCNMLWMMDFGKQIETLRGSWKMLLLTLLFAVVPNLLQYRMDGPAFGGMSGVVYGLFGYVWMKSYYEPESGFQVQPFAAVMMCVWFMLGLTYDVYPLIRMANWAHGGGLVLGLICGYAPTLLRSFRKSG